jgi:hypothetical protein
MWREVSRSGGVSALTAIVVALLGPIALAAGLTISLSQVLLHKYLCKIPP